jgi:hypothetical protein
VLPRVPVSRRRWGPPVLHCGTHRYRSHSVDDAALPDRGHRIIGLDLEVVVATVTVQLSDQEIKTLKARTGERNAGAALKTWVTRANPKHSSAALRAALKESLKQETAAGKGQRFRGGREAVRWLEN